MLDLSWKILSNPQNIYDGVILGLNYMPTKLVAAASATLAGGIALHVTEPETLVNKIGVVVISAGIAWGTVETAHCVAGKLWKKRWNEICKDQQKYENSPKSMEENIEWNEFLVQLSNDIEEGDSET